ncbi:Ig-like domain-containing protein [Bacteroidales bacterium]|nr:Ig-like domain-containing protein [Bacteroidales bacterium]
MKKLLLLLTTLTLTAFSFGQGLTVTKPEMGQAWAQWGDLGTMMRGDTIFVEGTYNTDATVVSVTISLLNLKSWAGFHGYNVTIADSAGTYGPVDGIINDTIIIPDGFDITANYPTGHQFLLQVRVNYDPVVQTFANAWIVVDDEETYVSSVALSEETLLLAKGEKDTLAAWISPINAADTTVAWTTSDTLIATIENGVVTAISGGKTTITATTNDGLFTASCEVSVTSVASMNLATQSMILEVGDDSTITPIILPDFATDKIIAWETGDDQVATVTDGIVTAAALGSTYIYATTNDGGFVDSCLVTVNPALNHYIEISTPALNHTWPWADLDTIIRGDSIFVKGNYSVKSNVEEVSLNILHLNGSWGGFRSYNVIIADAQGVYGEINGVIDDTIVVPAGFDITDNYPDDHKFLFQASIKYDENHVAEEGKNNFINAWIKVVDTVEVVTGVELSETALSIEKGANETITETVNPVEAFDKSVVWSTSDSAVAIVTDGVIDAVGGGRATITVTTIDGMYTAECAITVPVAVTDVALSNDTIAIFVGDDSTLVDTIKPLDALDKTATWNTTDDQVATVVDGVITGVGAGTAKISVTTTDGEFTDTCVVIVDTVAATGVALSTNAMSIKIGKDSALVETFTPANTTNKTVAWNTTDDQVATVVDGVVTAVSVGTTKISVTTTDGDFTDTCVVTVEPIDVTGIVLSAEAFTLTIGEDSTLTDTVSPNNATDKSVAWNTTDDQVATVVDGKVTAVGVGTAKISVTTTDGEFTDTCVVTVEPINVTGVTLSADAFTIKVNEDSTLVATITPEDATDLSVEWNTTDDQVATVIDGVVTATGEGTAKISVTTTDGEFTDTCVVTVEPLTAVFTQNESSLTVYPNPAQSTLSIKGLNSGIYNVKMYNMQGKVYVNKSLTADALYNVSVETLPTGLYFIQLNDESNSTVIKFTKQ